MLDAFLLRALITPDIHVDIPFLLAEFLSIMACKDCQGSPLYGEMLTTRIAWSFGIID